MPSRLTSRQTPQRAPRFRQVLPQQPDPHDRPLPTGNGQPLARDQTGKPAGFSLFQTSYAAPIDDVLPMQPHERVGGQTVDVKAQRTGRQDSFAVGPR